MKALVLNGYGDNKNLAIAERPKPVLNADQVLIRVKFAGLNPLDFKIRSGKLRMIRKLKFPHILGNEVAGMIESVGGNVSKFRANDIVYARVDKASMGGFADFVTVDQNFVAHAPKTIPLEVAAGIPLVALTAWQCLFDVGRLSKDQRILIHGAAGSVGRFAVQFAKQAGANVTASGSDLSRPLVIGLGADQFINYKGERFESIGEKFDVVLDLVGSDTLDRSFSVIREGGKVISISGPPEPQTSRDLGFGFFMRFVFSIASYRQLQLAKRANATYRFVFMRPDGSMLEKFANMIDSGKLKASIDRIFSLEEFEQAFEYQESGKAKGKVVFKIG